MSDRVIERLNDALGDRYAVERELGAGGMASVYLAHDRRHDRSVALKVLDPDVAAMVGKERFLAEIRTTANLQHPNILPLFDSGAAGGFLFYVMPYVEEATLRERLAVAGPLPLAEAVALIRQTANALQYAHDRGIIHRDVKPGNVLLQAGQAQVADFGIALDSGVPVEARLTRTGHAMGTPGYMSPQQAAGEHDLDPSTDVYALGALAFALLAGDPPFGDVTPRVALARILTEPPPDVRDTNPNLPVGVANAIKRALAKEPGERFESVTAFADALERAALPHAADSPVGAGRRAAWIGVGLLIAALIGAVAYLRPTETDWARREAAPEIRTLLGEGDVMAAFALAERATGTLPDDPTLEALYDATTSEGSYVTTPPGATLYYRPYAQDSAQWREVGRTPLEGVRLPNLELLVRIEHEGYWPYIGSTLPSFRHEFPLTPDTTSVPEVSFDAATLSLTGQNVALGPYRIDEYEVTNADYQAFIEEGGYEAGPHWDEVARLAAECDASVVGQRFVDLTGRPGPAGWELSRHPEGAEQLPVGGVSWFEAAAYCAFRGKSLPTYYHWKHADAGAISPRDGAVQHANLASGSGPVAVGTSMSRSARGVSDLAGNVAEWVLNRSGADRFLLGGSWRTPPHIYTSFDALEPWSREPDNGFRCARYSEEASEVSTASIAMPIFDFNGIEPVDDETFASYAPFFAYDATDLDATDSIVSVTEDWTDVYVEFAAAYLDDRVAGHLYLPSDVSPPYQAVVYFPGASAFAIASSDNLSEASQLMFIPRSGRILFYPVLKGTYERRFERPSRGPAERRQRYVWMVQDIMRSVDYLQDRNDVDDDRIAYMGLSFGAEFVVPLALEHRFNAAVLIGAALDPAWWGNTPEEVAPWNFVSRVSAPTLVVNGRHDFMHPYREAQVPFFELLGPDDEDKEFVVLETGHLPPNNDVIRLTLDWLDERLGPVSRER